MLLPLLFLLLITHSPVATAEATKGLQPSFLVNITVPPMGGAGVCSKGPVHGIDYLATAPRDLLAVLVGPRSMYTALVSANLTTANVPQSDYPIPLLSCIDAAPTLPCHRANPEGEYRDPDVLCILLKSDSPYNISTSLNISWIVNPELSQPNVTLVPVGSVKTASSSPSSENSSSSTLALTLPSTGVSSLSTISPWPFLLMFLLHWL